MTEKKPPQAEHARRVLEREAAQLDTDTTRALRLARHQALDQAATRGKHWPLWLGSVAASVVVLGVVLQLRDDNPPVGSAAITQSVTADIEVLSQEDDLGLIEDLEFLDWLSSVEEDLT